MPFEGAEEIGGLGEVARLNALLRNESPQTILRAAIERYGDKLALVSSFGSESAVLLHMAAQVDPGVAVLFLDTGMLFGQTLDYRKQLADRLG
ncbi:MAG: phosphoadenosine phosphosulfate reductase family protein, partial [Caulobacteraceae bacterium]|nr:phosphoadenosine phosphosulfate reductase family protein [Caulobacteraceae bacterium]